MKLKEKELPKNAVFFGAVRCGRLSLRQIDCQFISLCFSCTVLCTSIAKAESIYASYRCIIIFSVPGTLHPIAESTRAPTGQPSILLQQQEK